VFRLADDTEDAPSRQLGLDELASIVNVHAAAYRRNALVSRIGDRVYVLLPSLDSVAAALPILREAASAAARHLDPPVRAAIGPIVDSIARAPDSRRGADLALGLDLAESPVSYDETRPVLIARAAVATTADRPELHDPRIARLVVDEPELAETLLHLLDTGSDVTRVARTVHVHVTTVRYRLRRIVDLIGLDLDDPDVRLASLLQLRASLPKS
jgi:sugar diacid utilization regulator